jgi:hypothetical protein
MNEKLIASNMIAIARGRKGDAKRSAMLRMIMPFMSNQTGEKLAKVIHDSDSAAFGKIWDGVKHEILKRLKNKHKLKSTAAAIRTFNWNDDETVINVDMYGSEKLRVTVEGVDVWKGQAPGYREMVDATYDTEQTIESRVAELNPGKEVFETHDGLPVGESINKAVYDFFNPAPAVTEAVAEPEVVNQEPRLALQFDFGQTGWSFDITDGQLVNLLHEVCKRLLYKEDPCPLEPKVVSHGEWKRKPESNLQELSAYFTASKS